MLGFLALATEEPTVPVLPRLPRAPRSSGRVPHDAAWALRPGGRRLARPASRPRSGDVLHADVHDPQPSRLPKPWLEVHSPSTLPMPIPGRVVADRADDRAHVDGTCASHASAAITASTRWSSAPATPSACSVGGMPSVAAPSLLVVFPRVQPLPGWRLAAGASSRAARRTRSASHQCHAARHGRSAVRRPAMRSTGSTGQQRAPSGAPGQGVRHRADGGPVAVPRPRSDRARRAPTTTPRSRRRSAPAPRSRPGPRRPIAPWASRRPVRAAWWSPADRGPRQQQKVLLPAGRGAAGRRRAPPGAAGGRPRPPPPGHDRGRRHALARPRLGAARWRRSAGGASAARVCIVDPARP